MSTPTESKVRARGKSTKPRATPIDYRGFALKGLFVAGAAFGGYLLLVVAPFFANGLHLQPVTPVMGGTFDPKQLPPFTIPGVGWLLYMLAASLFGLAPLASMALVVLGLALALTAPTRSVPRRMLWFVPTAGGMAWWLFMVSSTGALIGSWFTG